MKVRTKRVALAGVFIALSIIFTRFLSHTFPIAGMPALRLSFGDLPLIISGITLGPVYGAFTGVLADLLGYPLNPLGAYFPGFTLSAALSGFLPGLMAKAFNKKMDMGVSSPDNINHPDNYFAYSQHLMAEHCGRAGTCCSASAQNYRCINTYACIRCDNKAVFQSMYTIL